MFAVTMVGWLSFVRVGVGCTGEIVGPGGETTDSAAESFGILLLEPNEGPVAGDTLVRIVGSGFTSETTAQIGGNQCATFTFLSSGEMLCVTPPGSVGPAELTIQDGAESDAATFTYLPEVDDTAPPDTGDAAVLIDKCVLTTLAITTEEDTYSSEIGVAVTVFDRTDMEGEAVGLSVELGYGPTGSDPSAWEWGEAYYAGDSDAADLYDDSIYITEVGTYEYAFRARVDYGDWTECLSDAGNYGALTVTPTTTEVPVDYCHLQYPCSTVAVAETESEAIYAWIYHGGSTDTAGPGPGLSMELGVGASGSDPTTDASWVWSAMTYNEDKDGLLEGDLANDEYVGTFWAPATAGSFDYVVRATADYGLSYTLCDLGGDSCNYGGSSDGYDDPGTCTVE